MGDADALERGVEDRSTDMSTPVTFWDSLPDQMGTGPYFSIIITTFNRPDLLGQATDSILAQSFEDWELIVVDDASPTPVVLPADPRIKLVRNDTNQGKAFSVNRALREAKGQVVAFLDDDDAWRADRLSNAKEGHTRSAIVVCQTETMGAVAPPPKRARGVQGKFWARGGAAQSKGTIGSWGSTSVERAICPELDVSFAACEDHDWALRLTNSSHSITVLDSMDHLWRPHGGYRHGNGVIARIEGHDMLLDKHREHYNRHPRELAVRYHHVGLLHYTLGQRRRSLAFALRSLRTFPTVGAAELVARAFLPRWVNWSQLRRRRGTSRADDSN